MHRRDAIFYSSCINLEMSAAHGQLSKLVALIAEATKTVEAEFAKSSKPYVPSLDDTEPHPLDVLSDSMDLRLAIQTIEGACAQLVTTVTRPCHTIFNVRVVRIDILSAICDNTHLNEFFRNLLECVFFSSANYVFFKLCF